MRPLTATVPKPLLQVGGKALIRYHLEALARAGITDVVINAYWLADELVAALGDGSGSGVRIHWSIEREKLETGGGILNALPLLDDAPFLLVSGDVWSDYPFERLRDAELGNDLARLVLVDNPPHHAAGDFCLDGRRVGARAASRATLTYSGIALVSPALLDLAPAERCFPLADLLRGAIAAGRLAGEHYRGRWEDVGTPERLRAVDRELG